MTASPSVLCAVDLSTFSRPVMQHAAAVADHFRARLVAALIRSPEDNTAQASVALRSFVRDAFPAFDDSRPEYDLRVSTGIPAATILRLAHEDSVDLVVLGTHGSSGYRRDVFGSTTEGVLRDTDVPVLVVPGGASDLHSLDNRLELQNIGTVMAPIDFGPLSRRDARIAAGIADTLGVALLLTHVSPCPPDRGSAVTSLEPDAAQCQLTALRSELLTTVPIETVISIGDPPVEIAALAAERRAGLIVMGLRGAGGAAGPRPGSIAYRTLCLTPTMLLALPPSLKPAKRAAA